MAWPPHITVAAIVEKDGKFLMVEEISHGRVVYNQPAGHLDPDESLQQAAVREAYEETGWHIEPTAVLGVAKYYAPENDTIYYRTSFIANAVSFDENAILDDGIQQAVWLSYEELKAAKDKLRSPLVLKNVEQYLAGHQYPLDMICDDD